MPKTVAIAYIPVLHSGYMKFLGGCEAQGITELYLIGDEVLEKHEELDYINRKDRIRALSVDEMKKALSGVSNLAIEELSLTNIELIQNEKANIVTPKEDIGSVVVDAYFKAHEVAFMPVHLRIERDTATANTEPEVASMPMNDFQKKIAALLHEEADKSFDWWRQVGAALIKGEEVICVTHNEHMPEAQLPNILGDARSLFKKGININYTTAAHAEVVALGRAAKEGITTEGAELYVTDFPCPYCARLIASAGIKTVYFLKGYAVLEGDEYLKGQRVEVIKLQE